MPVCAQGNIFDIALKVDLTIVFGHIAFNDLGGTWLKFKQSHPQWEHINDPFLEFQHEPQAICEGRWIWFIPDETNGGMTDEQLAEVFHDIFGWATDLKIHRVATNGVPNIDHDPDFSQASANRISEDRRARFIFDNLKPYEKDKSVKVTLISLTDVFVRNRPYRQPNNPELRSFNKGIQMPSKPTLSKKQFLDSDHVQGFIEFLKQYVSGTETFEHRYKDRRSGKTLEFNSIYDAFEKYSYPMGRKFREAGRKDHKSYATNARVLKRLQKQIREAFEQKNAEGLLASSIEILEWGGVAGAKEGDSKKSGNRLWLHKNHPHGEGLAEAYKEAQTVFLSDEPCLDDVRRSNAGFTKIYSLLFENFIIYDSRVAAALGLFVVRYCTNKSLKSIPPELDFGWMPAKEAAKASSPKLRNADAGPYEFSKASSERLHASANIRANWIFEKVLPTNAKPSGKRFAGLPKGERMRALESAFFMIGYDLGSHHWLPKKPIGSGADPLDRLIDLQTIAKGIPFEAQDLGLGYQLVVGQNSSKLFVPKVSITEIVQESAGTTLPIGSSRTAPPDGSLGAILLDKVSATAMASYVAPLLVHLGLAEIVDRHKIRILDDA